MLIDKLFKEKREMDAVLQLLISTSPFGYISKNIKKVLNDFFTCESIEKSYAYQYLNSSYYKELILLICLVTSYKNLSSGEKIDIDELDIGTKILFRDESYVFDGRDKICEGYYILTPARKKKDSVSLILKKDVIESQASIATNIKRNKVKSIREDFGKQLGLSSISWTNGNSVIVLSEKKILNQILDVQFNINGKSSYLGEFCTVKYLKDSMVFEQLLHSNSIENPMVIFSSNMRAVTEYLDENDGKISEKKVYVIGDKWFVDSQLSNLITLEDACSDFDIPMTIFSSVSSVMDESKFEFLKKMEKELCWLESKELNRMKISFKSVSNNEEFSAFLARLNEYLEEICEIPELRYLDKLLKRFLKMTYSQIIGNSQILEQQMIIISEYMEKFNFTETEYIADILYNIYCNRFGYQNKKTVELVRCGYKCALIVMNEMVEETKEVYKNDDMMKVLPYNETISLCLYFG